MRYIALATDYDGTLAWNGQVSATAIAALQRLRDSGRKAILVTGRELPDIELVFDRLDLFDRVVVENGALLYRPETREQRQLGEPPPQALVDELRRRGVDPISVGASIIATVTPHETVAVQAIGDLGLEHQVIFNKGSVMILPPSVNKGTGLQAALDELCLSPHNVVSIGDAENDHAFLRVSECAVAVADALPTLKDRSDYVTSAGAGEGVTELIDKVVGDDLRALGPAISRQAIPLGTTASGEELRINAYGSSILIAGPSGSGKSTATIGFLEQLGARGYQYCLIDPEGDYGALEGVVTLGGTGRAPTGDEVVQLLQRPSQSVVVSLTGIGLRDRPAFFAGLLPRLQELRAQLGRPHWIIVDEAHHLMPAEQGGPPTTLPSELQNLVLITIEPQLVTPTALSGVDMVLAVGQKPWETIRAFTSVDGIKPPPMNELQPPTELVWLWSSRDGRPPREVRPVEGRAEHLRHRRKYAQGDVGPDRSFVFRGPDDKLKLRAQNLVIFAQMAEGVDDDTWTFHLRNGDYSHWFREFIKDASLADDATRIERDEGLTPDESRQAVIAAIEARYTAPS